MAPQCVLYKKLTDSMIRNKVLYCPTESLPAGNGRAPVEFLVSCGNGNKEYRFRCRSRLSGNSPKPVIQRGWSQVIKDKGLQEGDEVELYCEAAASEHEPARYRIEVRRPIYVMGTIVAWHRIV